MKPRQPAVQNCHLRRRITTQSGYTLIELMIAVAIIGILAATAVVSYHTQVRKTQVMTVYQEINHFRLPYQILMDDGAGVTDFSPSGLNMPDASKYCQFSVTPPNIGGSTPNAVTCTIQNLPYMQGESISLDYSSNGKWQCRASSGITEAYLPQACR
ncbi:pilin [Psychrobacter glacincola]